MAGKWFSRCRPTAASESPYWFAMVRLDPPSHNSLVDGLFGLVYAYCARLSAHLNLHVIRCLHSTSRSYGARWGSPLTIDRCNRSMPMTPIRLLGAHSQCPKYPPGVFQPVPLFLPTMLDMFTTLPDSEWPKNQEGVFVINDSVNPNKNSTGSCTL